MSSTVSSAGLPATARFSSRVDHYIRSRPTYPEEILSLLSRRCGLSRHCVIGDIGSGTGLLAQLFLSHGNRVYGVEPNREMREAGQQLLASHAGFISTEGSAEDTGLPAASLDLLSAGQAFHWFDRVRARREFQRILKPGGYVVLLWNDRKLDSTPFLEAYEALLVRHCPEYLQVVHRNIDQAKLEEFFRPGRFEQAVFDNRQEFDWPGLVARHLSQSFVPEQGPVHELLLTEMKALFDACHTDGKVAFEYVTRVYFGVLDPSTQGPGQEDRQG